MNELPLNWIECEFIKIADLYTGNSINEKVKSEKYTNLPDGLNYIATKDIGYDKKINYNNGIKIPFKEKGFKIAPANSSLLCIEGGSAGRKIGYTEEDVCFVNKLCAFVSRLSEENSKLIYYYLQSNEFKSQFFDKKNGLIGGVGVNKIKQLTLKIPPLNEQKRIVKKLDAIIPKVDEVNSRLERVPLILKRARQSILNQAITGLLTKDWRKEHSDIQPAKELIDTIQENRIVKYDIACKNAKANGIKKPKALFLPQYDELVSDNKNWVKCYIANIFSVETGATPLKGNASYYKDGNIPWVKTGEVQNCEIFEAEEFITEKALQDTNVKIFPKNTLLIAMYGEGKTRGQVGRLKFEATTNQACAALVNTDIDYLLNEYVFYYCLSQYNEIRRQAAGGNQPNLNLDKIKLWEIDIPPLEEQEEIVRQVKTLFEKLDKIEENYKKAKQYTDKITQSVLHKAFTGNLVPQDPNDKPIEINEIEIKKEKNINYENLIHEVIEMKKEIMEIMEDYPNGILPEDLFNKSKYSKTNYTDEDLIAFYKELSSLIGFKLIEEKDSQHYYTIIKKVKNET